MDYNPKKLEQEILKFWEKNRIYKKVKKKGKKLFYFLDGPPYTSGRVHLGTAWNKALKDMVLRYKRMNNFKVWDRAGYDMHGLPTEHKIQEKFNLKTKQDIKNFTIKNFIKECENFSIKNMELMNKDFKRLGVWMDFDNAYKSISQEFIEGVWWLIKKAHDNKRLYQGKRTIHWCPCCATALAKHELEYKTIKEPSIFVKFKLKQKDNEYLIIWTTTPWTIVFNVAIMVNPKITYIKAKVDNEIWIIAKNLAPLLIQTLLNKKFKITEQFKGKKLKGLKYIHPFQNLIPHYKKFKKIHEVVLSSEYVNISSGTGLVHNAAGCGIEDYEVGIRNDLPIFNNLDEYGTFPKDMGIFSSLKAKKDDKKFIEELKKQKALLATTKIEHEYPHCWRCHSPAIFRVTEQWFFKIEDLKEQMIKLNKEIKWVPKAAYNAFNSWLLNLRDNSITKQRYWGTPLPIWKCPCNNYKVLTTKKQIQALSKTKLKNLHKPYIDKIKIKCEKCNNLMKRIPDVLDVWVDAGTASWNCLDFPHKKNLFKNLFPPDFILEGKDQIRGWFNLLFITSMIAFKKAPFKIVYMHGFVQDALGRKMSKSLGNVISPQQVINNFGADTLRYYMISGAKPGIDLNYNFKDVKTKYKNLTILWNIQNYLLSFKQKPKSIKSKQIEEKYILSKLNSTIKKTTELFENYLLNEIPLVIEDLFLELSRTYIKFTREKQKQIILPVIFHVLLNTLKLLAPVTPFITEAIYQNLKKHFNLKEQSIHLLPWPKYNKNLINKKLEQEIEQTKQIIQEILSKREKAKIGIRWPLKQAIITSPKPIKFKQIIKQQTNIKQLKTKRGKFSVSLDLKLTKQLKQEGYSRELIRRIQAFRKKLGLKKQEKINLSIKTNYPLLNNKIKIKTNSKTLEISENPKQYKNSSIEKIRNKEFVIYLEKFNKKS